MSIVAQCRHGALRRDEAHALCDIVLHKVASSEASRAELQRALCESFRAIACGAREDDACLDGAARLRLFVAWMFDALRARHTARDEASRERGAGRPEQFATAAQRQQALDLLDVCLRLCVEACRAATGEARATLVDLLTASASSPAPDAMQSESSAVATEFLAWRMSQRPPPPPNPLGGDRPFAYSDPRTLASMAAMWRVTRLPRELALSFMQECMERGALRAAIVMREVLCGRGYRDGDDGGDDGAAATAAAVAAAFPRDDLFEAMLASRKFDLAAECVRHWGSEEKARALEQRRRAANVGFRGAPGGERRAGAGEGVDRRRAGHCSQQLQPASGSGARTGSLERIRSVQRAATETACAGEASAPAMMRLAEHAPDVDVVTIEDAAGVRQFAMYIRRHRHVALDVEWRPVTSRADVPHCALLQVAVARRVFLIDLLVPLSRADAPRSDGDGDGAGAGNLVQRARENERCPSGDWRRSEYWRTLNASLLALFRSDQCVKLGYGFASDLNRLQASHPRLPCFRVITELVDLDRVAAAGFGLSHKRLRGGLSGLAATFLGLALDKRAQVSDWSARPLSAAQAEYAALDAWVQLPLYREMKPARVVTTHVATRLSALGAAHGVDALDGRRQWRRCECDDAERDDEHRRDSVAASGGVRVYEALQRHAHRLVHGAFTSVPRGDARASGVNRCSGNDSHAGGDDEDERDDDDDARQDGTVAAAAARLRVRPHRIAKCVALVLDLPAASTYASSSSSSSRIAGNDDDDDDDDRGSVLPFLVVMAGARRVHFKRLAGALHVPRQTLRFATARECRRVFGFEPGAIAPVGLRCGDAAIVLLDDWLLSRTSGDDVDEEDHENEDDAVVYPSGGAPNTSFAVRARDLRAMTHGVWLGALAPRFETATATATAATAAAGAAGDDADDESVSIAGMPRNNDDLASIFTETTAADGQPHFAVDSTMGKCVRRLRSLGIDTLHTPEKDIPYLIEAAATTTTAAADDSTDHVPRVILTRDATIMAHARRVHAPCYFVRANETHEQVREIVRAFALNVCSERFLARCVKCNSGAFVRRSRAEVAGRVPPRTLDAFEAFWECARCGQLFWKGSHFERATRMLAQLARTL